MLKNTLARLVVVVVFAAIGESVRAGKTATLEARGMRLSISPDANVRRIIDTIAQEDHLGRPVPFCMVVVEGKKHPARRMTPTDEGLRFSFGDCGASATLRVEQWPDFLVLTVVRVEGGPSELRFVNLCTRGADGIFAGRILCFGEWHLGLIPGAAEVRLDGWAADGGRLLVTAYAELPSPRADYGIVGQRAAIFACGSKDLSTTIGKIEDALGICGGMAGKTNEANRRSYLMLYRGVTHDCADRVVRCAQEGGFGSIVLTRGMWADYTNHWTVPPQRFPRGASQLREFIDRIHDAGMIAGAQVFTTVVPKRGCYTPPAADGRLYQDAAITLAADINATEQRILTDEPPHDWPVLPGTRDVLLDDEIFTYTQLAASPSHGFIGCRRGQYGTRASRHQAGARMGHLSTEMTRQRFLIDSRTPLQDEVAEDIARAYQTAGFDWVYFDGAGCAPPPQWYTVALGELALLQRLRSPPLVVEAAVDVPSTWHFMTRTGQRDYFQWSMDPKEEVDDAVARSVPRARQALMAANIGWYQLRYPDGRYATIDDIEYLYTKALAADAAVSIRAAVDTLDTIPHRGPLLAIMNQLEELRLSGYFPPKVKAQVRQPHTDFMLVQDSAGRYHLPRAREIPFVGGDSKQVRAFITDPVDGISTVSLWNVGPSVLLELAAPAEAMEVADYQGNAIDVEELPGTRIRIPVRTRLYAQITGMWQPGLTFRRARVTPIP